MRSPAAELVGSRRLRCQLDRRADLVKDRRDLAAQEDEGDNRDNRDEGEDQRVLGETLALLVLRDAGDECIEQLHVGVPPFLESSRTSAATGTVPAIYSCCQRGICRSGARNHQCGESNTGTQRESRRPPANRRPPGRSRSRQTDAPTVWRMPEIWPPRKMRATIATMAMSARISAYSARPWPSSSCDMRAMSALNSCMNGSPRGAGPRKRSGMRRTIRGSPRASNETFVPPNSSGGWRRQAP